MCVWLLTRACKRYIRGYEYVHMSVWAGANMISDGGVGLKIWGLWGFWLCSAPVPDWEGKQRLAHLVDAPKKRIMVFILPWEQLTFRPHRHGREQLAAELCTITWHHQHPPPGLWPGPVCCLSSLCLHMSVCGVLEDHTSHQREAQMSQTPEPWQHEKPPRPAPYPHIRCIKKPQSQKAF